MNSSTPLRYNISNWLQLSECRSNNSVDLYITVKQVIDDGTHRLEGIIILVNHTQYGTLFACTINSKGTLLTPDPESGKVKEFTEDEILDELNKFGFDVTFEINQHLSGDQISYLITLDGLGYDKIRYLPVFTYDSIGSKTFSEYIVAFNVGQCPATWLDANFECSKPAFLDMLNSGAAINLTNISKTRAFDWTWLTYIGDIEDIIEDNGQGE